MSEKVFTTIEDQINILQGRCMDFSDPSKINYAKTVLNECGYYNLVNGYNNLFLTPAGNYKPGTSLYEIHALYQFDRVLREIFFRYILKVETHIKSLVSYYYSAAHGHKNYLIYTNFNTSVKDAPNKIMSLISEIQKQIAGRTSDPSIEHYIKDYGYIPLWVLSNILTLGTISKFYSLMLPKERQQVSRIFKIMDNELESIMIYISGIRNFCAHGNRLYCYRSKKPLINLKQHDSLSISKSASGEYLCGKRDLFAALISLRVLLSKNDYKRMEKELSKNINTLRGKLSVITIDDVLTEMGFPSNWKSMPK